MKSKILFAPVLALSSLSLGACAQNYAVEGAGAGAALGAGLAALTDGAIDANHARVFLVQDGIDRDRGLAGLPVADD